MEKKSPSGVNKKNFYAQSIVIIRDYYTIKCQMSDVCGHFWLFSNRRKSEYSGSNPG